MTGSQARRPCRRHSFTLAIRRASRPRAGALRRRQPRAHQPPAQRSAPAVSGSRGIGQACVPAEVRSRRRAPRQPAGRPGGHAARTRALDAPSSAVGRRACGRPRRGAVAAVLPHWDDDDDRLPGGRLTRALPPRANGHDRGAWCERRNRAASARWAPRLPGQPASGLHPHALVRAAVDHFDRDRRGLWVRHAGTRAQSNTHAARGLTVRRSPSIGANTSWCHSARDLVFARLGAGVTSVRPAGGASARAPPGGRRRSISFRSARLRIDSNRNVSR